MSQNLTVQAIAGPRMRNSQQKSAPIPSHQQRENNDLRQQRQAEISSAVHEWNIATVAKAEELANRFDKKPRYFLDLFYQGGAHMIISQAKVNPFNAFKSLKSAELVEAGSSADVVAIQTEFKSEYENLTEQEKADIVDEFSKRKAVGAKQRRPNARGRIQDTANVARNIQMLLDGLKDRVGIEAFFCIVRNTPDFHMPPQWYFTLPAIDEYMKTAIRKWDTAEVGTRLEAFAIAGCDVINLSRTSKQKADALKKAIRDKIATMLIEITGNPSAAMQYTNYEEQIVHRYGVELRGWTFPRFVNPSHLTSTVPPLRELSQALDNGSCKFIKLPDGEVMRRREEYEKKIVSGEIANRKRKERSDAGKKRKQLEEESPDIQGQEKENVPPARKKRKGVRGQRSAAVVEESE